MSILKPTVRKSVVSLLWLFLSILCLPVYAQEGKINGRIYGSNQEVLTGASIRIVELNRATSSDQNGQYLFTAVPMGQYTIEVTYIGYLKYIEPLNIRSADFTHDIYLEDSGESLGEVTIVGYAGVRKKDLTGAVSKISSEDFNQGPFTSPDQLIQGKASGVQMINNSGQPGGGTTVQIRGSSAVTGSGQPLYIVDGVALDGRTARPSESGGLGTSPSGNPLTFLNPNDIAEIEILKDASATAIYGSRAAYGVVLITTKRGQAGGLQVDVNASTGLGSLMRKIELLNGDEYRAALNDYGLTTGDFGDDVDALDEILRTAINQNYNLSLAGGAEDSKFRTSLGYQNQDGIIKNSGFKKFVGSFNGNFKMLSSKKLGLDVGLIASQTQERIAPITTDAGFQGSVIGQALNWNPTQALRLEDGSLNVIKGSTIVNPLAMVEAYDDRVKLSTIMANISPYYKLTDWLEYRFLASVNYNTGIRRASTRSWINIQGIEADEDSGIRGGYAGYINNELITSQLTHTLTLNKELASDLNLNAVLGYEYMNFINKGMSFSGRNYGDIDVDYTDALQAGSIGSRTINSYYDPTTELQSYFFRGILNYQNKYLLTATIRRDGSTKFGENNEYGNFPSFSAAWNIRNEDFLTPLHWLSELKLRAGWGKTGNQEFPSGAAVNRYSLDNEGRQSPINNRNLDLKWQSDEQINVGLDFGFLGGRLWGTIDYFQKKTSDLLYPVIPSYPIAPGAATVWMNLDGQIENKGVELSFNGKLIERDQLAWNLGGNVTFLKNNVKNLIGTIITGALSGQGMTGATLEIIQAGFPMFAMMTREYIGLDAEGFSQYTDDGFTFFYLGDPNPRALVGISTDLRFKKWSATLNFNGLFGRDLYNNTANSVIPITNLGTRNIAKDLIGGPIQESLSNPIAASSRFIENGSYLKLANATIGYQVGDVGGTLKNLNLFINGTNLLLFTKYKGFDPEVNTQKSISNVPSAGIDYIGYPPVRTFNFGINFTL